MGAPSANRGASPVFIRFPRLAALAVLLLVPCGAGAQGLTGALIGTVTDQQGGAIRESGIGDSGRSRWRPHRNFRRSRWEIPAPRFPPAAGNRRASERASVRCRALKAGLPLASRTPRSVSNARGTQQPGNVRVWGISSPQRDALGPTVVSRTVLSWYTINCLNFLKCCAFLPPS